MKPLIIAALFIAAPLFAGLPAAQAADWERSGDGPVIYCNAPETGTVPRGRVYGVTFFTDGATRAERNYSCTIRRNPSTPMKPEIASTTTCTFLSNTTGSEQIITGQDSSQALFESSNPAAICAHAYFKLGIQAQKKP
jgi:hypothetical protein